MKKIILTSLLWVFGFIGAFASADSTDILQISLELVKLSIESALAKAPMKPNTHNREVKIIFFIF